MVLNLGRNMRIWLGFFKGWYLRAYFLKLFKQNGLARLKGQLLSYYLRDVHLEFIRTPFQF